MPASGSAEHCRLGSHDNNITNVDEDEAGDDADGGGGEFFI